MSVTVLCGALAFVLRSAGCIYTCSARFIFADESKHMM